MTVKSKEELEEIAFNVSVVAKGAGDLLIRCFNSEGGSDLVAIKDDSSPVSKEDLESQKFIEENLKGMFPSFGIVSEEKVKRSNIAEYGSEYFIIDPLDSTKNFLKRIPFFDISIALYSFEKPLIGVVYDPVHDKMYSGISGHGAYCNGRKLKTKGCESVEKADVDINCTKLPENEFFNIYNILARKARKVRYFGNAVLEICWIASGNLDAVINHYLSIWDIGACGLILEEAGGVWSTLDGNKPIVSDMIKFPIVASGSKNIHKEIIDIINR